MIAAFNQIITLTLSLKKRKGDVLETKCVCVCGRSYNLEDRCKNCGQCSKCHGIPHDKYRSRDGIDKPCTCRHHHCIIGGYYSYKKYEKESDVAASKSETKKIIGAVVYLGGKGKRIVALDDNDKVVSTSDFFPDALEVQWVFEGEDPQTKAAALFNAIKGVAGLKYEFGFLSLDSTQIAELPVQLTYVQPPSVPGPLAEHGQQG